MVVNNFTSKEVVKFKSNNMYSSVFSFAGVTSPNYLGITLENKGMICGAHLCAASAKVHRVMSILYRLMPNVRKLSKGKG